MIKKILLYLIFFSALLQGYDGKDLVLYQYAGFSHTVSEYTKVFTPGNLIYLYGQTNTLGLVYDYTGFLKKNDLNLRSALQYKYLYIPLSLTIRREKNLGYSTNTVETEKTASFFPDPRTVIFFKGGIYGSYKSLSLGICYQLQHAQTPAAYPESRSYWHYFHTNSGSGSLSLDFVIDQKIFKLPLYVLGRSRFNPVSGFRFDKKTIYEVEGGLRLDFNYYISTAFKYRAFIRKDQPARHMFQLDFNYNILPELAVLVKYSSLYFAKGEFPSSRFDLGLEYVFTKDFKNEKK